MTIIDLYNLSITPDLKTFADDYLKSRGVSDDRVGYIDFIKLKKFNIQESILIPSFNVEGDLISLDVRSVSGKTFHKISSKKMISNIYNIDRAIDNPSYCVVTESAIDCMSFLSRGINSVATLSASIQSMQMHLLSLFDNIILCFDNDEAGVENAKRALKFFYENYNKTVEVVDYYSKDPNEALNKNPKEFDDIIEQIVSYTN